MSCFHTPKNILLFVFLDRIFHYYILLLNFSLSRYPQQITAFTMAS